MNEAETSPALKAQKKDLREKAKLRRQAAWLARPEAGLVLREQFLRAFTLPKNCLVAAYAPLFDEIDPTPLALDLYVSGHRLALPIIHQKAKPLGFREWKIDVPLVRGSYGIFVPPEPASLVEPDVVLVPLLAFDAKGNRIGYGGGYYDCTLRALQAIKKIIAIGLAFSAQEEDSIPISDTDFKLDAVVTEKGVR